MRVREELQGRIHDVRYIKEVAQLAKCAKLDGEGFAESLDRCAEVD